MVKKLNKHTKDKKKAEKQLHKKLMMFDKLDQECLTCGDFFDKTSKEMRDSWTVVVKDEDVRLYCPTCWEAALEVVEDFRKRVENRNENT
jgi:Zn finger protein HypA/HybF involved in hydrogenase expression